MSAPDRIPNPRPLTRLRTAITASQARHWCWLHDRWTLHRHAGCERRFDALVSSEWRAEA